MLLPPAALPEMFFFFILQLLKKAFDISIYAKCFTSVDRDLIVLTHFANVLPTPANVKGLTSSDATILYNGLPLNFGYWISLIERWRNHPHIFLLS